MYEGVKAWSDSFEFCLLVFLFYFLEKRQFTWRKVLAQWIWFQEHRALGWRVTCRVIFSCFTSTDSMWILCGEGVLPSSQKRFSFLFYASLRLYPSASTNTPVFWIVSRSVAVSWFILSSPTLKIPPHAPWYPLMFLVWPGCYTASTPFQGKDFNSFHCLVGKWMVCFCAPCCIVCSWEIGITPLEYTGTCILYDTLCSLCIYIWLILCVSCEEDTWIVDLWPWWPAWGQHLPLVGMYSQNLKVIFYS